MCFLLISWLSKNVNLIFQSLNHSDINLKPQFFIKSGYYVVPSPSTALLVMYLLFNFYYLISCCLFCLIFTSEFSRKWIHHDSNFLDLSKICEVQIFWEGQKTQRNLPLCLTLLSYFKQRLEIFWNLSFKIVKIFNCYC